MTKYNSAKVLIIVNVASNCGYTYTNYRELVDIYDKYHSQGLEILAFPSNQFGERNQARIVRFRAFATTSASLFPL